MKEKTSKEVSKKAYDIHKEIIDIFIREKLNKMEGTIILSTILSLTLEETTRDKEHKKEVLKTLFAGELNE
jgi:hypothetical protein